MHTGWRGYRKLIAFGLCLITVAGMAWGQVSSETPYWAVVGLLTAFIGGNWAEYRKTVMPSARRARKQTPTKQG